MTVPFFSNKIMNPAGDGPTWDEWVKKTLNKTAETSEEKTASEATPECSDGDPRSQCRGQVVNNDNEEGANSYQKGESVDGKPSQEEGSAKAESETESVKEAGKEMGECSDAGKVTEEHGEAAPADEGSEAKSKINNDPCYQKGESTDGGKVTSKNKKTEAVTKSTFKKVASLDHSEKIKLFASLSANKKNPIEYVEAMVGLKFANLTEEEKAWFKDFWRTMYPEDYVNEMVADR